MTRNTLITIIIVVTISTPFALMDYAHFPYCDGPEHGAAVRALAKNLMHPDDPMLQGISWGSPRYVPSILLMALVMRLSQLDVLIILKLFLIVYFALFLIAAALFSNEYFNDRGQAPWSIACLLFLWGIGWTGANAYMFSAILYTAYFPSVVSFSIALLALYFQLRFLRDEQYWLLLIAILLGVLCFINHPLTGVFFLICTGLLHLEQGGVTRKTLLYYTLSIVTTLFIASIWPYYNFFASVFTVTSGAMQKAMDYNLTRQYLYSKPLLRSGLALAGIPFLGWYLFKRQHLLLWGGFLVFSFAYSAGYRFHISLVERTIFFIVFFMQIAVSRTCREWFSLSAALSSPRTKKIVTNAFILLLTVGVIIQSRLTFQEFIYPAFTFRPGSMLPHYVSPNSMQNELKKYFNSGDIILSDLYSSWSIPVYTGAKIIALWHTAPHITDNLIRIGDVEKFYDLATSVDERLQIFKKYGVTHVFLNFKINGKELEPILEKMGFGVTARTESFCIFTVFNQLS